MVIKKRKNKANINKKTLVNTKGGKLSLIKEKEEEKTPKQEKKKVNLKIKIKRSAHRKKTAVRKEDVHLLSEEQSKPKTSSSIKQEPKSAPEPIIIPAEQNNFSPKRLSRKEPVSIEKIERDKQLIMWSGVIFFMILIIFGWIYNTKQVLRKTRAESESSFNISEWRDAADEIGEKMDQLKKDLEAIKTFDENGNADNNALPGSESINELKEKLLSTSTVDSDNVSTDSDAETEKTMEEINELKKKLEELENKINN